MRGKEKIAKRKLAKYYMLLLLLWMLIFSTCVFAGTGDGSGTGGGENQGIPLELVSSTPADGAKNVELSPTITLQFSKNVVNLAVKDNNKDCFSLKDSTGNPVEIQVVFPDDQVEPEKKRIVYIQTSAPLQEGVAYTLTVSDDIRAKSGSELTGPVSVTFSTKAAEAPAQKPVDSSTENPAKASTQNPTEPVVQNDEKTSNGAIDEEREGEPENNEPENNEPQSALPFAVLGVVVAVIAIGTATVGKKRK